MKISAINLEQIEQLMLEESHIERASCYYDAAGRLCIKVVPQQPILHVISQKGEDYYLSSTGLSMSTGTFNVDLCVATGNITKKFAAEHLLEFARYIHDDLFWSEQIEQIHVVSPEQIELYPRVGQHNLRMHQHTFDRNEASIVRQTQAQQRRVFSLFIRSGKRQSVCQIRSCGKRGLLF